MRLISPGTHGLEQSVGLGRAWAYHTQDTPALCTWEPSPGAGVVVSARASSLRQPGSRALHFVLTCFNSTHTPPSEPLPPTLGWAGVKEKEKVDLHQLQISCPQRLRAEAAVSRSPWSLGWGLPASPRGKPHAPMLSRPPSWSSIQTRTVTVRAHVTGLIVYPGSYTLPSSYIAEWPEPLRTACARAASHTWATVRAVASLTVSGSH